MTGFEKLEKNIKEKKSHLVLGLDPDVEVEEDVIKYGGLKEYLIHIVDETNEHIVGIKPNLAFYEISKEYREVLSYIMNYASDKYGLVKILDAKRGDIMSTQSNYSKADMYNFNPDIVTLNPYMGGIDVVKPYLDMNDNICVYVLTATSNSGAREFQDVKTGGITNYQKMALISRSWDSKRVGFVVGATKIDAIKGIRAIEIENGYKDNLAHVLCPGFGKQGGNIDFVKYASSKAVYPISSGLTKKKYLAGMSFKEAAIIWKNNINESLANSFSLKSIKDNVLDNMIKVNLIKVTKEDTIEKWPLLKKGRKKLEKNNINLVGLSKEEKESLIRKALEDNILDKSDLSPIFLNIRDVIGYKDIRSNLAYLYTKMINEAEIEFNKVGSIAYGAINTGDLVADYLEKDAFLLRKERNTEATHSNILGKLNEGDKAIMIEDVTTSANSLIDDVKDLRKDGVEIKHAFIFVKRTNISEVNCLNNDIKLHYIMDMKELIDYICNSDLVEDKVKKPILDWAVETKAI